VGLPAVMKLLGHTSPDMTMRYIQVVLSDLRREFDRARSKPRHLVPQPKAPIAAAASRPGRRHGRLALGSACAGNVPPGVAERCFTLLPGPALQPAHQDPRRSTQTRYILRMGRDWPVMSAIRTLAGLGTSRQMNGADPG